MWKLTLGYMVHFDPSFQLMSFVCLILDWCNPLDGLYETSMYGEKNWFLWVGMENLKAECYV
jgi:hypothetical protein